MTPILVTVALDPLSPADADAARRALEQLREEDGPLCVLEPPDASLIRVSGTDAAHLTRVLGRLRTEFGVQARPGPLTVDTRREVVRGPSGEAEVLAEPWMTCEITVPARVARFARLVLPAPSTLREVAAGEDASAVRFAGCVPLADLVSAEMNIRALECNGAQVRMQFAHYAPVQRPRPPRRRPGAASVPALPGPRGPRPSPLRASAAVPQPDEALHES